MPISDDIVLQEPVCTENKAMAERTVTDPEALKYVQRLEQQWMIVDATLSSIADFAYTFDSAGRFVYVNRPLLDLWGKTLEEALGKSFFDLQYPYETAARLQHQIQEVFTTGNRITDETPYTGPTGTVGYYEYIFSPIIGAAGTIDFVAGTTRDITVRKDSERHLEQMEARYRGLLEAAPDAMVVVDEAGAIVLLNVQAEKQFGYSRDELVGRKVKSIIPEGFAERLIADGTRTALEALEQQIGTGIELNGRRKDGARFPIEIMLSPLESPEGVLITAAIRDISERKQLTRQLHQSQKMEAVGQLTGGIAHDFNNLLTVIIGNLGLLDRLVSENEPAVKRIRTAQKAAARAADITRRLLLFSSNEELNPAVVVLGDSIQNMIEMASRALGSDITITTGLDQSVPPLFVDPAALESALLNLVVNARDAMPKGGSIIISSELLDLHDNHPTVKSGDLKKGPHVCVRVTDTGQGMSRETLERACEPFYTTKPQGKGTGLGLAMVYGFVKQSGGIVRIYSEVDHGTTVSFYLPIRTDLLRTIETNAPRPFNTEMCGTVLVVDDEEDIVELALVHLAEMGLTVLHANDGPSALQVIAQHDEIDLLITDIVMPGGMNGVELVQRARDLRPGLKIIYSSGFPAEALTERTLPLLHGPLLRKPYKRAEMVAIVQRVMEAGNERSAEPEVLIPRP
jgi:PAS domain S-box-containing protein